jgi:hypothetical protein
MIVIIGIVLAVLAWRMLPAFIEGYRGTKGGFFAAVGKTIGRKLGGSKGVQQ